VGFVPWPIVLFLFFFCLEQAFSFLGSRAGGLAFFYFVGLVQRPGTMYRPARVYKLV
jgi:hypothetical protein